ncbi:MAG: DUF2065 domain-containing protein [Rhodospirillaceae bacterium]|nr:DUF2065 domain-containing protein [Rhodospirillaceae bacterium]
MTDLLSAFGLVLVIEGALYALFPGFMRRAAKAAFEMPENQMRVGALATAGLGIVVVWLVRGI